MIRNLILLLFLAGFYSPSFAQTTVDDDYEYKPKKLSARQKNKRAYAKAIKQLREGGAVIYLVRDRKVKTEALKEKGLDQKAAELEKLRTEKHLIMVRALAKKFKFCPIYFCFHSDLEKIQQGQFQGNLLDTNLVKNDTIQFKHNYFLLLDYSDLYDIQGETYCDTCKTDYTGKMSLKNNCLVFKNKYLMQLDSPFPYFYTCHYPKKEIYVKIRKMNQRLMKFYSKLG